MRVCDMPLATVSAISNTIQDNNELDYNFFVWTPS
jgi:hypothetical protein